MTSNLLTLLILVVVGFGTGILYFQGLWWTLKGLKSEGAWTSRFLGSFAVRAALVVGVFYLLMGDDWRRVAALTLGFVAARFVMIRRLRVLPPPRLKEQRP